MTELDAIIRQMILSEGPIPVARYMQLALQHPLHGYYMKGDPLGVAGDFTTAPEISQMFGEMIGLWCADSWQKLGSPDDFVLLELGAGRGNLMQDALRATKKIEGFHQALSLYLLDTNETLVQMQREKLGDFCPCHIADISSLPKLPIIAIANEFMDALPIHQYQRTKEGWRERLVAIEGDKLVFVRGEQAVPLPLPDDKDFFEVCPLAVTIVQQLSNHIVAQGGAALLIDYGYVEMDSRDTLQAVSGHAFAGILHNAGATDLSAHVDFTALKLAAERQGACVLPIITQGEFLRAMGIDLRAWQLKLNAGYDEAHVIDDALARLTEDEQMGTLFKVMSILSPKIKDVAGFP